MRFATLVAPCLLLVGLVGSAGAGFNYDSEASNLQLASGSNSGGFGVGGQSNPYTPQSTPTTIALLSFGVSSSVQPPASESFAYSLTDTVSFTNVPPPGSSDTQSLALSILISFTNVNSAGSTSTITINGVLGGVGVTAAVVSGGQAYQLSNFVYVAPTGNGLVNGRLSATVTAVPEPASLTLVAIAGVVGLAARRRRAA